MYIHGQFLSKKGEVVSVYILTHNDRSKDIEIGKGDDAEIYFTDNPVEMESQVGNTFDVLWKNQATIHLELRNFVPDFFCASCFDAVVNIYRENQCIFAGFIEPQAYSQSFVSLYDTIDLSCIDVLTAMQYYNYTDVVAAGKDLTAAKIGAQQRTFGDMLGRSLQFCTRGLSIAPQQDIVKVFYDGSIAASDRREHRGKLFSELSLFDLLIIGNKEGDVWTIDTLFTELLRYPNLHIIQVGFDFFIFHLDTLKCVKNESWQELNVSDFSGTGKMRRLFRQDKFAISLQNAEDTSTQISVGEVYSLISLSCEMQAMDDVIESPLEEKTLQSPYPCRQRYLKEYISFGTGKKAADAFDAIVKGQPTDYDAANVTTWFMQVRSHPSWKIGAKGEDFAAKFGANRQDQQAVPNYLASNQAAAILSLGAVAEAANQRDNSPTAKVDMDDYLVIGVNGNADDTESGAYPQPQDLRKAAPLAVYNSNYSGGVFSPTDEDTTNYLVFSGEIILNGLIEDSLPYNLAAHGTVEEKFQYWRNLAKQGKRSFLGAQQVRGRDGNLYNYTRQWLSARDPQGPDEWAQQVTAGLTPFNEVMTRKEYQYKFSAIEDEVDRTNKISVLACMLIIGDKCVVEVGNTGTPADFVWRGYQTLEQCGGNEDMYYSQSFTLGFNPKLGDELIGNKFKMQNNIDYRLGLDTTGTAIPIKMSDELRGKVEFKILGAVNTVWNDITRRHRTWFRGVRWKQNDVRLLAHVSNIMIKSFELKVVTDGGKIDDNRDNELVYYSQEGLGFTNKNDSTSFKIVSALTRAERLRLGIKSGVFMSTPFNEVSRKPVAQLWDAHKFGWAKPEEFYVSDYYNEYSKPRVVIQQTITDTQASGVGFLNCWTHPALDSKKFFVQAIDRSLIDGTATLTLKEINDEDIKVLKGLDNGFN